jgi:hypothetical protein
MLAIEIALTGAKSALRVHQWFMGEIPKGASQFCKSSLIPQPLLPRREKGSRIGSPSPSLGEGFRVRATKVGCTHPQDHTGSPARIGNTDEVVLNFDWAIGL